MTETRSVASGHGLGTEFTRLDEAGALALIAEHYGVSAERAERLATEKDDTFRVDASGSGWDLVLKVAHPGEDRGALALQDAALRHLAETTAPAPRTPRLRETLAGDTVAVIDGAEGPREARLTDFIAGTARVDTPLSPSARHELGRATAQLAAALADFTHPAAARELLWGPAGLAELAALAARPEVEPRPERREALGALFAGLLAETLPALAALPRQVVHGDVNYDNVLLAPDGALRGIIDFGDLAEAPVVWDVAVACSYEAPAGPAAAASRDPWAPVREMLAGVEGVRPLSPAERDVFPALVRARVAQRYVAGAWLAAQRPENAAYALRHHETLWAQLSALLGAEPESLLARRQRVLSPSYRLFYEEPIEPVSGRGTLLTDREGVEYLDAYNNVPCVGHCHPRVVAAISAQAATLNTHTRYLGAGVVDYAERLLGRFPAAIDSLTLACTGSEANDLALRMAKYVTGRQGIIVTEHAYHGVTTEIAAVSPSLGAANPLGAWVRTVRAPDPERPEIAAEGFADVASWFAAEVAAAADELEAAGSGLAALLIDTVLSSDGLLVHPAGAASPLLAAEAVVRARGGLLIADEVQAGFARTGEAFWGFERHGLSPDLVTMGKPMGAGMPISGVAARGELVAGFGREVRYFNTFGGNAVSVAAANAVLDVIDDENLLEHARDTGERLGAGLRFRESSSPLLTRVRGVGLFWAVDAVDAETAGRLVNRLRGERVLISATGPGGNVLKIRPPLVFSAADTERFLLALDRVLEAEAAGGADGSRGDSQN